MMCTEWYHAWEHDPLGSYINIPLYKVKQSTSVCCKQWLTWTKKVIWNWSKCWMTQGTTASNQIWNGIVPVGKDSSVNDTTNSTMVESWKPKEPLKFE